MDELQFDIPWHKLDSSGQLEKQLYREVGEKHTLYGKNVKAIAQRQDCDDVLFFCEESDQYAIVHLTWSQKKINDLHFPSTIFYKTQKEIQDRINADIKEWIDIENSPIDETGGFIKGKQRIIIVGASSGIGREMAKNYALEGNLVAVTARRTNLLEELQSSFSGRIIFSSFDVTKSGNQKNLDELVTRLGGLDLLIISSGIGEPSKELSWELDKLTVETNVNGFVEIANWGFNFFVKQGYGHLVTISSIAAERGNSWAPAYSASKAFQNNYFEGLSIKAKRLKKDITLTCFAPGFVNTKMAKGNKQFWVIPVDKCVNQMIKAIKKKKRMVYISHRWWIIAKLMRWIPYWLYKRIV